MFYNKPQKGNQILNSVIFNNIIQLKLIKEVNLQIKIQEAVLIRQEQLTINHLKCQSINIHLMKNNYNSNQILITQNPN